MKVQKKWKMLIKHELLIRRFAVHLNGFLTFNYTSTGYDCLNEHLSFQNMPRNICSSDKDPPVAVVMMTKQRMKSGEVVVMGWSKLPSAMYPMYQWYEPLRTGIRQVPLRRKRCRKSAGAKLEILMAPCLKASTVSWTDCRSIINCHLLSMFVFVCLCGIRLLTYIYK